MDNLSKSFDECDEKIDQLLSSLVNSIVSLSTGSIVLSITLFDKISKNNDYNYLMKFSWIMLALAIFSGLILKYLSIHQENDLRNKIYECIKKETKDDYISSNRTKVQTFFYFILAASFFIGIVLLVIYSILQI